VLPEQHGYRLRDHLDYFEVDIVPTFDSASIIRSGMIRRSGPRPGRRSAAGKTPYYVRAMAGDGSAGSGWTEPAVAFFVNTANDAAATPVIAQSLERRPA